MNQVKKTNALPHRDRLLEAAAHILATEGHGALTVRRLAGELGTSTIALYRRFAGIEELVAATADEFMARYGAALRAVPTTDDALLDLAGLAATYRSISITNADLYRVAFTSRKLSVRDNVPQGINDMFAYCRAAIDRCIGDGTFPVTNATSGVFVLWTALHGHAMLEMERVFESPRQAKQQWTRSTAAAFVGMGATVDRAANVLKRAAASIR